MKRFDFDKLVYVAKQRGYRQKDLAELIGMDEKGFSEKKRKGRELSVTQWYYIAAELGTTLEMFMTGEKQ
jgi:transcriptional regulator with XRE-family HTH domain